MTSTVLDVTVMLLCVSASVVALGGPGGDPHDRDGPTADTVADRLTTETATVRYRPANDVDGDTDARTVHATLAELLVIASATDERHARTKTGTTDGNTSITKGYRASATDVVSEAFGPRNRLDVVLGPTQSTVRRPSADGGSSDRRSSLTVGSEPPRSADVTAAVVTMPASTASSADRVRIVVRVW